MADVTVPLLRSLVERARAVLGSDFERLYAKHMRGELSNPHRLILLVMRVQDMIDSLEQQRPVPMDHVASVTLIELNTALTLLENARTIPAFSDVGATVKKSQDYLHTFVMLAGARFLADLGNGQVEYVATQSSPTPDLRVRPSRGSHWHVEVYVPQALVHPPQGHVEAGDAARLVEAAMRRKKRQLRLADSLLFIGGLGCGESAVESVKLAAAAELIRHDRPTLLGIGIFSALVITEYSAPPDGPPVPVKLHFGSRTGLASNPRYGGSMRLSPEIPDDAPLQRIDVTPIDSAVVTHLEPDAPRENASPVSPPADANHQP